MTIPGAPSLTQPRNVRTTADSFAFTDSGSDFSDGGVAVNLTTPQKATTDSSMRETHPSKKARRALRKAAATSAGARSGSSPVVAVEPTTTDRTTANSSGRTPRPSKKARKALRKRKAAASASAGAKRERSPVVTVQPRMTEQATADGSLHNTRLSKKARKALRKRKAAAAAKDLPAGTPADASDQTGIEASNGVTEIVKTITVAELNVLRAIEANYNALGAKLGEHHAQQMAWTEQKVRVHRKSEYGYGTIVFFLIIFLMIFSTYIEAEERRRSRWW
jgi:hypothetical protein